MDKLLGPLLIRVPILEHESLASYITRTSDANLYDRSSPIKRLARPSVSGAQWALNSIGETEVFNNLGMLTLQSPIELGSRTIHRFAEVTTPPHITATSINFEDNVELHTIAKEYQPVNHRSERNCQFCVDCMRAEKSHNIQWSLWAWSVCLEHKQLMQDRCFNCGSMLSIRAIVDCQCAKCGFDLRESPDISVAQDIVGLKYHQQLQTWLSKGIIQIDDPKSFNAPLLYRAT